MMLAKTWTTWIPIIHLTDSVAAIRTWMRRKSSRHSLETMLACIMLSIIILVSETTVLATELSFNSAELESLYVFSTILQDITTQILNDIVPK